MRTAPAPRCAHCANPTRDPSGRCHHHRVGARDAAALMAPLRAPVRAGVDEDALAAALESNAEKRMSPFGGKWSSRCKDRRVVVVVDGALARATTTLTPTAAGPAPAVEDVVVARAEGENDARLAARAFFTSLPDHADVAALVADEQEVGALPDSWRATGATLDETNTWQATYGALVGAYPPEVVATMLLGERANALLGVMAGAHAGAEHARRAENGSASSRRREDAAEEYAVVHREVVQTMAPAARVAHEGALLGLAALVGERAG